MRSWTDTASFTAPRGTRGVRYELECRFISPVFGGGPEPKKVDPITPIRVPSLRGQLRFWWRATRADLKFEQLLQEETKIFGGVHGGKSAASCVDIHVSQQPGKPQALSVFLQGNPYKPEAGVSPGLAYGAFPLRGLDAKNTHDYLWVYSKSFKVSLALCDASRCHDLDHELQRALWAWLHFGGLGGRTRRGFGAVELVAGKRWQGGDQHFWSVLDLRTGWQKYVAAGSDARWAVLSEKPTMGPVFSSGRQAQERLLGLLHQMRQGPQGRTPNKPRPGRSFWPEPDAIRSRYPTHGRHETPIHNPRIDAFPRAAFGAPIIFHFKQEKGEREPPDTSLQPVVGKGRNAEAKERLASPLVLRPHGDGQGNYQAMALRLAHPEPDGWCLVEGKSRQAKPVNVALTKDQANRIAPLAGENEAIAAYMKLLRP